MNKEEYVSLERRTVAFSVAVINLLKSIPHQAGTEEIKGRMVRSATQAGAEYRDAVRSYDLIRHVRKLAAAAKDLSECAYWINLLHELHPDAVFIENILVEACDLMLALEDLYRASSLRLLRSERACHFRG